MLNLIASALNRNDEAPNIEIAEKLAKSKDAKGIAEIASGLSMKNAIANDCIKVLYEIGERNPELIAPHADEFLNLLKSKNNRLVWGAMAALEEISPICAKEIYARIGEVVYAYENGSVITIDHSISVFASLCKANQKYEKTIVPILLAHFEKCRAKEIPQHFERLSVYLTQNNVAPFQSIIDSRYDEMTQSQQSRIKKVIKTLN